MALSAKYLADKSALARFPVPAVGARLRPLMEEGLIATCAIIDLDVLFSSRSLADYERVSRERSFFTSVEITPRVWDLVFEMQCSLAERGQHRLAIPDIIISAVGKVSDLTILHYDTDFERLKLVGGASQEWIIPRGSAE